MKNKLVNYFLIVAVICVWGIIIYRIVEARGGDDSSVKEPVSSAPKKLLEDYTTPKDTTGLLLSYRNPFEGNSIAVEKEIPIAKLVSQTPAVHIAASKSPLNWNFITYTGYIRNSKSKKMLAIVNIRGTEYMMAEGETDAQVKLIKNLKDSIKISFDGRSRFIAMNTK